MYMLGSFIALYVFFYILTTSSLIDMVKYNEQAWGPAFIYIAPFDGESEKESS